MISNTRVKEDTRWNCKKEKKNHSRVGISGNLLAKKLNLCKFVYFLIRTRLNKENFIAIEKNLENHSNHIVISEKRADNEKAFPVTRLRHLAKHFLTTCLTYLGPYSQTACSFDGNFANFRRNIGILVDSLSRASCNQCEQVAQFIWYLMARTRWDFPKHFKC